MKAANVAAIMAKPDVDGALVGGASLDADEFVAICRFRDHLATLSRLDAAIRDRSARARRCSVASRARVTPSRRRRPSAHPTSWSTDVMRFASLCRSCWCSSSLLLILLVLLHKGKGGGLSDMFGGGMSSSLGGSSVAERNLDRITVGLVAASWLGADHRPDLTPVRTC